MMLFLDNTPTTDIYTLSLHDALPISIIVVIAIVMGASQTLKAMWVEDLLSLVPLISFLVGVRFRAKDPDESFPDRKSTRLNSSHSSISYAVFCLKKKINKFSCILYDH